MWVIKSLAKINHKCMILGQDRLMSYSDIVCLIGPKRAFLDQKKDYFDPKMGPKPFKNIVIQMSLNSWPMRPIIIRF